MPAEDASSSTAVMTLVPSGMFCRNGRNEIAGMVQELAATRMLWCPRRLLHCTQILDERWADKGCAFARCAVHKRKDSSLWNGNRNGLSRTRP